MCVLAKLWVVCVALLPALALACGVNERKLCQERWQQLVSYRTAAIGYAFGDSLEWPDHIGLEFIRGGDPRRADLQGGVGYDVKRDVLLVAYSLRTIEFPEPLSRAQAYWPFYDKGSYLDELKVVDAIDNALWTAYLHESAQAHGSSWPHAGCASIEVSKRLPCEMVLAGIVEHLTSPRLPLFNESQFDMIWREDFTSFQRRVWFDDPEYQEVKRYGGILLMRPLIAQFGVLPVMSYAAQTPFEVHEPSLRLAAQRYQQQAREALTRQMQARTSPEARSRP